MNRRLAHATGFAVSALVHGGLLIGLLLGHTGQRSTAVESTALALELAMFQPQASPMPSAAAEEANADKPSVEPESRAPADTDPPEPVEKPVAESPRPDPHPAPAVRKTPAPEPPVEPRRKTPRKPVTKTASRDPELSVRPEHAKTAENRAPGDSSAAHPQPPAVAAAPVAAATPPRTAVDSGIVATLEAQYMAALRQAIEANKFYPKRASRLRREGSVIVDFTIDRDGNIDNVRVTESSGTQLLDQAAVEAVKRLGQFHPLPSAIPHDPWSLQIPMSYKLL